MNFLLPMLAFGTMGIMVVLALYSQKRTDERQRRPDAPKSHLAKNGPGPAPLRQPEIKIHKV